MKADLFRVSMDSPDDISGVVALIEDGKCRPEDVICIMGKTEGNGCVNDFSRGFSNFVLADYFSRTMGKTREKVEEQIALIMSGGTEGDDLRPSGCRGAQSRRQRLRRRRAC